MAENWNNVVTSLYPSIEWQCPLSHINISLFDQEVVFIMSAFNSRKGPLILSSKTIADDAASLSCAILVALLVTCKHI